MRENLPIDLWKPIRTAGLYLALGCAGPSASEGWFPREGPNCFESLNEFKSKEKCEEFHGKYAGCVVSSRPYGNCWVVHEKAERYIPCGPCGNPHLKHRK